MERTIRSAFYVGWVSLSVLAGCGSENDSDDTADTGAAPGAGGDLSTGGVASGSGGTAASGAVVATGGVGAGGANTGGVGASAGGTGAVGTTGGTTTTGGSTGTGGSLGTGGSSPVGGTAGTGGAPGGTAGTGGASSTGGTAGTGTGGVGPTGGVAGTGGVEPTGGTAGSGGVTDGVTICGTADEGQSAILTCPEGQVIDSVVFASYGNPTGSCGSFAIGDCHAASSDTMVDSLCVGRDVCSVPASNGAFGDPCNSVVKSLAVEVACVEGEPTVGGGPYKGVANSPAAEIAALGATWCYNWGTSPQASDCGDPLFVPMIWGAGDVAGAIQAIGNAGYDTVLAFNEPNKSDQANMTVQEALALWPDMTSDPNIRVSSPAVSDDGRAWLVDFMDQVQANGLRVDFIAMHWYGWNAGSCVPGQLEGAVNWASQWGLPVWITEFGCMGSSNPDEQTLLTFFDGAIAMLDNHPLVERYAWYPWNTYNHLYENGTMTALGSAFAAAPQYR